MRKRTSSRKRSRSRRPLGRRDEGPRTERRVKTQRVSKKIIFFFINSHFSAIQLLIVVISACMSAGNNILIDVFIKVLFLFCLEPVPSKISRRQRTEINYSQKKNLPDGQNPESGTSWRSGRKRFEKKVK